MPTYLFANVFVRDAYLIAIQYALHDTLKTLKILKALKTLTVLLIV